MAIEELRITFEEEKKELKTKATFDKMMKFYYLAYKYLDEVIKSLNDKALPLDKRMELYAESYKLINELNSIMIHLSKSFAPKLAFSFILNGIDDTEWFLDDLMKFEAEESLIKALGGYDNLHSKKIVDFIIRIYKDSENRIGSGIKPKDIAGLYERFAFDINMFFKEELFGVTLSFYEKSIEILKRENQYLSEEDLYSENLKCVFIKIIDLYRQYKRPLPKSISDEVLKIDEIVYRDYQSFVRNDYLTSVEYNLKNNKYDAAKRYMNLVVEISEERYQNIGKPEHKIMLRDQYKKYLSFLKNEDSLKNIINEKLDALERQITHADEYVLDGEREYPRSRK